MSDKELILEVLSPVAEVRSRMMAPNPRLKDLRGKKIAFFNNHKTNASATLDYLARLLGDRIPDVEIFRCGRTQSSGQRFEAVIKQIRDARVDALVASYGD
ncbi:MAG: hypothetical protein HYX90_03880 [Chloroflexi bacterium]|nr:hypothetical protein [Chloroflexota bacterium]